ncbi:zinc finger, CCHC-type containing protein [Tanacetum coccineum]
MLIADKDILGTNWNTINQILKQCQILTVRVPKKTCFTEFVDVNKDGKLKGGFSIAIFCLVLRQLPYTIQPVFVPFINEHNESLGNYDQLLQQIDGKECEAAARDITISANRTQVLKAASTLDQPVRFGKETNRRREIRMALVPKVGVEPRTLGEEHDKNKSKQSLAFLFQAIPEDMVLQMASYTDPKQVWDGLKIIFLGVDRLQKARSLGYELEEVDLVKRLLDSMPKSFLQIVASIEQCFELDSMLFDEAVGRLKAYEERIKGAEKMEDTQGGLLLVSEGKSHGCKRCGNGGSNREGFGRDRGRGRGSWKSRDGNERVRDKSHVKCYKCEEFGHYNNECPKWEKHEANLIEEESTLLKDTQQIFTASLSSWLIVNQLQPKLPYHYHVVGYQNGSVVRDLAADRELGQAVIDDLQPLSSMEEYKTDLDKGIVNAIFDEGPFIDIFLATYGDSYRKVGPLLDEPGLDFAFSRGSTLQPHFSSAIVKVIGSPDYEHMKKKYLGIITTTQTQPAQT